jgi:hypothetical protein
MCEAPSPPTEALIAGQKVTVVKALAEHGISPDPMTAAALFEIGTELLVRQGIAPDALLARIDYLVLRARHTTPKPGVH